MRLKRLAIFCSLTLVSCSSIPSVGPNYLAPQLNLPESLNNQQDTLGTAAISDAELKEWWKLFSDPHLEKLVGMARDKNLTLQEALAKISESRALRGFTNSSFYPDIGVAGIYDRGTETRNQTNSIGTEYSLASSLSWELDFFGGSRRALEAAKAEVQASEEGYKNLKLLVSAEVAENYLNLVGLQQRVHIAEHNAGIQEENLKSVKSRFDAGLTNELDLLQSETQLQNTRSQIPLLKNLQEKARTSLISMIVDTPADINSYVELYSNLSLPNLPAGVLIARPAEILRARPDVQQVERILAAQTARKGEAIADYFPKLTIGARAGYRNESTNDLLKQSNQFWDLMPDISWPLFTGGRLDAVVDIRDAQLQQTFARYKQVVIDALSDAEYALASLREERNRSLLLEKSFLASDKALVLAKEQYAQGLIDFQRVLDSERQRFVAEDSLLQSKIQTLINFVRLMKAFGMGTG